MANLVGKDKAMPIKEQHLRVDLRMPEPDSGRLSQDEEWCEVGVDGEWRRLRFHDYAAIYEVPGLYERLFYEELKCCSPRVIRELVQEQLERSGREAGDLVVIDVGAGNGMMGEELAALGAKTLVGVDIIEEAAVAAERDRPEVYEDYLVADLTHLDKPDHERMAKRHFNCLTSVAALGFGDIPPAAFATAYELLQPDALVAFTIKEDFLSDGDRSGFERLIREMVDHNILQIQVQRRYRHRLSAQGEPLHYVAIVARKAGELGETVS